MRKYAVVDKDSKKLVEKKTNILLDIRKIIGSIFNAYQTINSIIKAGGYVLFVHTRNNYFKTASELNDITKNYLKEEATRVKSPYINQR
jgi:ribosomal protein S2